MTPMHAVAQVAGREIRTRIASKAFRWTTAILLVVIVVGGVLLDTLGGGEPQAKVVGLTASAVELEPALTGASRATGVSVEVEAVDTGAGEERLRDGSLDALVTGTPAEPSVVVLSQLAPELEIVLDLLWQQLALDREITALGGDPASVAEAIATAGPAVRALEPAGAIDEGRAFIGALGGVLIFIALTTTGQLVAQGVVEEKTSRVVELLLATIRPWELMAGKVLGIGAIGLLQLALIGGAATATATATGALAGTGIDLSAVLVWLLVWFVLGYAMYALVLAAAAALVSRQEDVGAVITPVIVLMMIPYFVGVTVAIENPASPVIANLSYFPLFSPILMPIRIATGAAQLWELALTVALAAVLIPLLVWIAGKIYGNAVLRTGARVSLRAALGRDR